MPCLNSRFPAGDVRVFQKSLCPHRCQHHSTQQRVACRRWRRLPMAHLLQAAHGSSISNCWLRPTVLVPVLISMLCCAVQCLSAQMQCCCRESSTPHMAVGVLQGDGHVQVKPFLHQLRLHAATQYTHGRCTCMWVEQSLRVAICNPTGLCVHTV